MEDMVVLVADKSMKIVVETLLARYQSLQMRPVTFDIFPHPNHDSGCCHDADNFLRMFVSQYQYAMVMFDHEGSGQENTPTAELQDSLEQRLHHNGWANRCRVVVIDPELEMWVWSDSGKVDECLGWSGRQPDLRTWLRSRSLLGEAEIKPSDPKRAVDAALREVSKPRSSAIFGNVAKQVSLSRCTDPSFMRFRETVQSWFPVQGQ